MHPLAIHHRRNFITNSGNLLRVFAQVAVLTVFQRRQRVNHTVDRQLAPDRGVDIVMPGDVGQHALQHIGKIAIILWVILRRANMTGAVGDVDDNVAVAAGRLRCRSQQQRLFEGLQLVNGTHAVVHEQNRY